MSSTITTAIETIFNSANIGEALTESPIAGVMQLTETIKVDASDWENCLHRIENLCAVKWIIWSAHKKRKLSNDDEEHVASETMKKSRVKRVLFTSTYQCHRAGSYTSAAQTEGRYVQKRTKKCNCSAKLKVVCYYKTPDFYFFVPLGPHINHVPGDRSNDVRTLPLTSRVIDEIEHQLTNSSKLARQIRRDILRQMDNEEMRLTGRIVSYHDVWNQMQKVRILAEKNDSDLTLVKQNTFVFGFRLIENCSCSIKMILFRSRFG